MNVTPSIGSLVYLSSVNPGWSDSLKCLGALFIVTSSRGNYVNLEMIKPTNSIWRLHVRYLDQFDPTTVPYGHGPYNSHLVQGLPQ
jgi:hypothetical protein